MKKDVDGLAASLKGVKNDFKGIKNDYKAVSKALVNPSHLDQIKKDMTALSSAKLDKKMFDLAIRHEERLFQQKLDLLVSSQKSITS